MLAFEHPAERNWRTPAGLEVLDRQFGKAWRLAAIVGLSLVMAMTMMTVLAVAEVLSELLQSRASSLTRPSRGSGDEPCPKT